MIQILTHSSKLRAGAEEEKRIYTWDLETGTKKALLVLRASRGRFRRLHSHDSHENWAF